MNFISRTTTIGCCLLSVLGVFLPIGCAKTLEGNKDQSILAQAGRSPRVTIDSGDIEGVFKDGLHIYKGIPYAAPPVGNLRWRAPQPTQKWSQPLKAYQYGANCPQQNQNAANQDEDCLFLNVWAPADASTRSYPVMVWIHGGGFINGSGRINGETFAKQGVVFVSINYRLGRLGSFAHPALLAQLPAGERTSNFWLLDQVAALKWVQRNIGKFGGNPSRVTIFGVSAGGTSVNLLMTSPLAKGLFHGAIAQSGTGGYGPFRRLDVEYQGIESQLSLGQRFARLHQVDRRPDAVAALRALPWKMAAKIGKTPNDRDGMGPVVDGLTLLDDLQVIFRSGRQHKVPFIAGANSFEGNLSLVLPWTDQPPKAQIQANLDRLAPLYGRSANDPQLWSDLYGDVFFRTSALYLVDQMQSVKTPSWNYHFDYVIQSLHDRFPGAGHGSEVMFVFGNLPASPFRPGPILAAVLKIPNKAYPIIEADWNVARAMQGHWLQFAKTGNPNGLGLPEWPSYSDGSPVTLVYGQNGIVATRNLDQPRFDLLFEIFDRTWPSNP